MFDLETKRKLAVLSFFAFVLTPNHIMTNIQIYGSLIFGAVCFVSGIYYMFIPMKKAKGIRHEDLPAFSKASGALRLPVGAGVLFLGINEKFDMFYSTFALVFPLAVSFFFIVALNVLSVIYRRRNREEA